MSRTQNPHMVLIKCFQTEEMPESIFDEVYEAMAEEGSERTKLYVTQEHLSPGAYEWFVNNGAEDNETVLLELGEWN